MEAKGRVRTGRLAALATVATGLIAAAPAVAQEIVLSGSTDEGDKVTLRVGEFGNATSFKVGKMSFVCERGGELGSPPITFNRLDRSDPGSFANKAKSANKDGDFKLKTTYRMSGSDNGDGSWSGVYKRKTKVLRDGKKVDTCSLNTNWTAAAG